MLNIPMYTGVQMNYLKQYDFQQYLFLCFNFIDIGISLWLLVLFDIEFAVPPYPVQ